MKIDRDSLIRSNLDLGMSYEGIVATFASRGINISKGHGYRLMYTNQGNVLSRVQIVSHGNELTMLCIQIINRNKSGFVYLPLHSLVGLTGCLSAQHSSSVLLIVLLSFWKVNLNPSLRT